jgi:hypothetical protein
MEIKFKQLPPHWSYLISKRTTKELIAGMNIDCRVIEYMGTGKKPGKIITGLYFAGNLEARLMETNWCFRLSLWGLPDRILDSFKEDFSLTMQEDIKSFVLDRTTEIVNSTAFPLDRRFYFRLTEDDFLPEFKTRNVQGITENWANRSPWWL